MKLYQAQMNNNEDNILLEIATVMYNKGIIKSPSRYALVKYYLFQAIQAYNEKVKPEVKA